METWYFFQRPYLIGFVARSAFWVQFSEDLGNRRSAKILCVRLDLCNHGVCLHPKLAGWCFFLCFLIVPSIHQWLVDQLRMIICIWKTSKNHRIINPQSSTNGLKPPVGCREWLLLCFDHRCAEVVGCRCNFGHASLQRGTSCVVWRDSWCWVLSYPLENRKFITMRSLLLWKLIIVPGYE